MSVGCQCTRDDDSPCDAAIALDALRQECREVLEALLGDDFMQDAQASDLLERLTEATDE